MTKKAGDHLKLYPEITDILKEMILFFVEEKRVPFNFQEHLIWKGGKGAKKSFSKRVNELFPVIPKEQKKIFLKLSNSKFMEFLAQSGFSW
jgi:hypothetical protein